MRRMWKAGVLLAAAVALYQVGAGASGSSVPPVRAGGLVVADADDDAGRNGARRLQQRHRSQGQGPQARSRRRRAEHRAKDQARPRRRRRANTRRRSRTSRRPPTSIAAACTRPTTAWASPIARPATTPRRSRCTTRRSRSQPGFPDALEYRGEAYLGAEPHRRCEAGLPRAVRHRSQAGRHADEGDDRLGGRRQPNPAGVDPAASSRVRDAGSRNAARLRGQTASMALAAQHETWR